MSARTHELLSKHVLSFGKLFIHVAVDGTAQQVFDGYWKIMNDAAGLPDQVSGGLLRARGEHSLLHVKLLMVVQIREWACTLKNYLFNLSRSYEGA